MINKFKKLSLGIMLTGVLVTTVPYTTYANLDSSNRQTEAPSSWAKSDIENAKTVGLIPNSIKGNYKRDITREEFSELAVNLYEKLSRKQVSVQGKNPFNDTKNSKVIIANQLGIIKGRGDGTFDPYEKITREEVSIVLYNTLKLAKPNNNYDEFPKLKFEDNNKIANWANKSVGYLYGIEVINGSADNLFQPKGYTTREESIILAKRMYDRVIESDRTSRGRLVASRTPVRTEELIQEESIREESSQAAKLKELLSKEMGKPYKWGATGPNNYDCSGLTYSIYGRLGTKIGRTSSSQINSGIPVEKNNLQYGDLVLFARDGKNINHVGIYVGDGNFVHSPQTGDVVKTTTLSSGYYANSYYAARRILK